jgi:hypothetical protein
MKLKIVAAIFAMVAMLAVSTAVFANHQWLPTIGRLMTAPSNTSRTLPRST